MKHLPLELSQETRRCKTLNQCKVKQHTDTTVIRCLSTPFSCPLRPKTCGRLALTESRNISSYGQHRALNGVELFNVHYSVTNKLSSKKWTQYQQFVIIQLFVIQKTVKRKDSCFILILFRVNNFKTFCKCQHHRIEEYIIKWYSSDYK